MIFHFSSGCATMNTQQQSFPSSPQSQNGSGRLIVIIVLAVLLLAGVGYALFFRAPSGMIEPSAPVPPAAKQAKPDSARDIINQLKESPDVDYDGVYQQASEFMEEGDVADAQLLFFFAARQGHGPSALVLARLYDPVGFNPDTSLMDESDAYQAYKWYTKARAAGEDEATDGLNMLKTWCETAAAEGDDKAARVLLQWEQ